MKKLLAVSLSILFTCACASNKPVPAPRKLTSYPTAEDNEKTMQAYCRIMQSKNEPDDAKTLAANPVLGPFLIGNAFYATKKYTEARPFLLASASKGFPPAQELYAEVNGLLKGDIYDTYAYFYLAQKSQVPTYTKRAQAMLEEIDKNVGESFKKKGVERAALIESAYSPEYDKDINDMQYTYMIEDIKCMAVLLKNKAEADKEKAYAAEKKAL